VHAIFRHDYSLAVEPASTPGPLVQKKTLRDSLSIDMLLSSVSFLVVAQSSSEVPEGLMNNPVHEIGNCLYIYLATASDFGGNNIPAPHQETRHKMHCVSSRLTLYFFRAGYIFVPQLSSHPHLLSIYLYFFLFHFLFHNLPIPSSLSVYVLVSQFRRLRFITPAKMRLLCYDRIC